MRIGADGSYLRWRRTGLGRYLDGLLHATSQRLPAGDELYVYYNSRSGEPLFDAGVQERFIRLQTATAWHEVRVPIAVTRDHCDVYLGGANLVPGPGRFPKVLVVHDCMAFRDPSLKPGRVGRHLRRWMRVAARRADRVVTLSHWSAQEAETFLGLDSRDITVIPPGIDARFSPATGEQHAPSAVTGLAPGEPYVLQVGAFELHKGGAVAVEAVDLLRRRGHQVSLVRCGGPGPEGPRPGTIDAGFVSDDALVSLYRGAAAVCVPSTHEGFGLPVLEAMACGAPVVAARAAALTEAGGEAALYAEAGDAPAFADALQAVLLDPTEAGRRRVLGQRHAAEFTWDRAAGAVLEVLVAAVRGRG